MSDVEVVDVGTLAGTPGSDLIYFFYFSMETFTTLGFGDIYPTGALRLLASVESLNGIILIAWSGTFTYLAVQQSR